MHTIEKDKLIADFMELDYFLSKDCETLLFTTHNTDDYDNFEAVSYHSSYEWLMSVVEKIEKMDFGFKICRKVVEVYIDSTKEVILKNKEKDKFTSLYKSVVETIEYLNSKKL